MDSGEMFPLDHSLLIFLKFFVVTTCIFFWVRLAYDQIFSRELRHRTYRQRYRANEQEGVNLDQALAELDELRKERDARLSERDKA